MDYAISDLNQGIFYIYLMFIVSFIHEWVLKK